MAGLNLEIPEDYLKDLLDHSFDDIAKKALEQVAPELEKSVKTTLRRSIKHTGDSELLKSIRKNKPKQTKTDAWIVNVYPSGYSNHSFNRYTGERIKRYPVSNALKAIWLEYGRVGQPASPWLAPAVSNCSSKILAEMQKIWEKETGAQ
jgi:hypothetical protein